MHWPQITFVVLAAMGVGIALAKNGEPRGKWSFGSTLFGAGVELGLLYAGGFFG